VYFSIAGFAWLLPGALAPAENVFAAAPESPRPPPAQTSREGGVTVKVMPRSLHAGAASWDFEVSFETHTQSLNQDLVRAAVLVDAQGKSHSPLAWDGDPPGGHHRSGMLRFRPLAGNPATVELRILGIGGVETRSFRWQRE